jgi:oligopeptide/dipeptide ABC transporter ATP-binding protein
MPESARPILEVRDLRTLFFRRGRFGALRAHDYVAAVDGVSFNVSQGECLGIVGESGCGKTTLGRTILRLVPATAGSVRYRGQDLLALRGAALRKRRPEIQMIFQDLDAALNPKMRVGELLTEAIRLRRSMSADDTRRRAEALLDLVNLKPIKLAAYPPELSGGEKRRVSIARVLAVEPAFIVADEPLSALDVSIAAQVANLMRELMERLALTYLFISHDLRMVELIAHRVLVMYLGKVVELAPARELAVRAMHPYSQMLWSAVDPEGGRRVDWGAAGRRWELFEQERPRDGCRFRDRCPTYYSRGAPEICRAGDSEPRLTEIAPGHQVACHFPERVTA